ncbi:glycosyltransferase 87 family protein [Streptomyces sp. Li-HN-5-11]|uniref:glycosyltransferase 87 family protein n=1 Tax=Streptomyces sp. Li-HN-5-11 TaxID=3075432 RepID=UPI0028AC3686|nr:glycosyltransferase 87 family protein [Streptomyces sp. Li-HN-5-11]WNM36013.1 glycosyltransferase 87 family protein [Streptomyces sp. Li-HN-5-11]
MTERTVALRARAASPFVLLAVSFVALAALFAVLRVPMPDALVYRAEGSAVIQGRDLYGFTITQGRLPATYPPFAAVLFVPTALLSVPALKAVFLAGNALLLAWLVHLSARLAGRPAGLPLLCAATALAVWLEPVFQTFVFGQINLAITCLVLWDLTRPPGARGKGAAIGVATGIKLTPGLFVVYLLLRGRGREAATATAAFAGTVAVGALVLPGASVDYWTRRLFETNRVGKPWIIPNQSLQGLIARALRDPSPGLAWILPALAVAAVGLWLARRAPHERWGVLLTGFTALLVSPISWSHHWVWCVPLIAVLLAEGRRTWAGVAAVVFTARTLWLVRHGEMDLRLPWWQQPLASPYALLGLALLASALLSRPDVRAVDDPRLSSPPAARPRR